MTPEMQHLVIALAVLAAALWLGRCGWRALHGKAAGGCGGCAAACPSRKGCTIGREGRGPGG